jgi:hypothetical protein
MKWYTPSILFNYISQLFDASSQLLDDGLQALDLLVYVEVVSQQ